MELGNTFYCNPHGLDHQCHKSTAYDQTILTMKVLDSNHQIFRDIINTRSYQCKVYNVSTDQYVDYIWTNTNTLLIKDSFWGVKTGIT